MMRRRISRLEERCLPSTELLVQRTILMNQAEYLILPNNEVRTEHRDLCAGPFSDLKSARQWIIKDLKRREDPEFQKLLQIVSERELLENEKMWVPYGFGVESLHYALASTPRRSYEETIQDSSKKSLC